MAINQFGSEVLGPYEASLPIFFDQVTGAVLEPGREDGTPAFLFTEVTGYALLDRLLLHSLTQRQSHLDAAQRSANWIVSKAIDPTGGVLTRYYFDQDERPDLADKSFVGRRIYSFDTAICLRGLVALYKATRHEPYLHASKRMGRYLVDIASNAAGEVVAIYDAKAGAAVPSNREVWSRAPGAFLSKAAEALIDLYSVTGDTSFAERAKAICEASLKYQGPRGSIETSTGRTELHPHCYATEGLLHVGRETGEKRFVEAARKATQWALSHLVDGKIAQVIDFNTDQPLAKHRTDSLAQVLALGSDLRQMGELDERYFGGLDQLADTVLSMREGSQSFFRYGYYERPFNGQHEAKTYSYWTQMFCLRGLEKYYVGKLIERTYVAVLAGGIGSRVWPLSCEAQPKHLSFAFLGDRSLLQETISRYTDGYFISPERVIVLCRGSAVDQMAEQAARVGVPRANIVIEPEPKGTIPASFLAMDALADRTVADRLVVVSMADNAITPHSSFQAAVKAALITAAENDCVISVGRPIAKEAERDERLGHMSYAASIGRLRVHQVEHFVEKPNEEQFSTLRGSSRTLATESGAVIFRESYFRAVAPAGSGNLAEHLLCQAKPWSSETTGLRVATTLLSPDIRFEDFGVPGRKLQAYHAGDHRFDLGNGITCVGPSDKLTTLLCTNTLVLSDRLPIKLYGLNNVVVIDSDVTNTSVVMPIDEVNHLPQLYRLFQGAQGYEGFITGGPPAKAARPTAFVERCPHTVAEPSLGLVFAYNIPGRISVRRSASGLEISNLDLPALSEHEFAVLADKQKDDPKLVEHLLHVGTFAKLLTASGDFSLSVRGQAILHQLILYHAIGGQLSQPKEELERALVARLKQLTKLDRRLLDTRIVVELLRNESARSDIEVTDYINHYISSAVEYVKRNPNADRDVRDIVTMLIQVQDSPEMIAAAYRSLIEGGLADGNDEIPAIISCFKSAQNFINGRWLWKRSRRANGGFLRNNRGPLEDFPFILAFTIDWLKEADINPRAIVSQINSLLTSRSSDLTRMLNKIDQVGQPLLCDLVYQHLLVNQSVDPDELALIIETGVAGLEAADREYQLNQLLDLPANLQTISAVSCMISTDKVDATTDAILSFYHKYWREMSRTVEPERIANLLRSKSQSTGAVLRPHVLN